MRLTKHGHACVRLESGGRVLVIDPGTLSGAESMADAWWLDAKGNTDCSRAPLGGSVTIPTLT